MICVGILYDISSIYLNIAFRQARNVSFCIVGALFKKQVHMFCRENSTKKLE
ncbi:hypothetical protein J2Y45_003041 [Dyadobacter sp. BE34]|uniref:Uncharacterized protein n=1 Tax=Dyadobacter fermentans TaxID=94254 RepID=A0ABU1QU30_9BACT|nr:hypothetical protein [Dyadobacter fermentans]MDR7043590.1 hypothetical protein [Dyadobacter sp. BE242]MDR7197902.1 hypothetical protein [Dyadobacter sp. BE34]MDR7214665.1 hypothetical protein [Dyadobacter sp. BE31]MDR7262200.1 hypothetical protein [Dyadobacter sp. BE32]